MNRFVRVRVHLSQMLTIIVRSCYIEKWGRGKFASSDSYFIKWQWRQFNFMKHKISSLNFYFSLIKPTYTYNRLLLYFKGVYKPRNRRSSRKRGNFFCIFQYVYSNNWLSEAFFFNFNWCHYKNKQTTKHKRHEILMDASL